MVNGTPEQRLDVAKYSLELSYNLITHYDNKTNQQLMIVGFDFAIISMIVAAMFTTTSSCGDATKITILVLAVISYILLACALWQVRKALMPHIKHHKGKSKPGLLYFKDIKENFSEEEYVELMLGKEISNPTASSKYYKNEDTDSFLQCIIEDCARDVFAHAVILEEKTEHVHKAFTLVFATTISCIITVAVSSILWMLGV